MPHLTQVSPTSRKYFGLRSKSFLTAGEHICLFDWFPPSFRFFSSQQSSRDSSTPTLGNSHCWSWACSCLVSAGVLTADRARLCCGAGWRWSLEGELPDAPADPSPHLGMRWRHAAFQSKERISISICLILCM